MTTITPARDATLKATAAVKVDLETRVANGDAVASDARLTEAIMCAAMLAWADETDRGLTTPQILAGLEAAFANAITSTVRTICNHERWTNMEPVFEAFMQRLDSRVCRMVMEGGSPNVSERVRQPKGGNA